MAWQTAQEAKCSCGLPRSSTMAPDGPEYRARALRCRACESRDVAARSFSKRGGDMAGMHFPVEEDLDVAEEG